MKLEEGAVTTRQVATVTISKAGDQRVILAWRFKPLWNAQEQNTKIKASHSKRLNKQMIEIEEKTLDQTKTAFIKQCYTVVLHMHYIWHHTHLITF